MALDVLIAGGGPAALEAALRLHRLAGDKARTTVLAPEEEFTYRPLSVLAPFAAGKALTYPMTRIAADVGFEHRRDRLGRVDSAARAVETASGDRLPFDVLLVAVGAVPRPPFERALTFGGPGDEERMHGLVQDVEGGYARRLAFVVPAGNTWPLPLYELALMLAERAYEMGQAPELHLVTPEDRPLAVFGREASDAVAELLDGAGVRVTSSVHAELLEPRVLRFAPGGERLEVDRVVTLPLLEGPHVDGLPADRQGFIPVDRRGAVAGVPRVFAAGDATTFPVKQGGLACQQADAAAEAIAALAGAEIDPEPFSPVLRGVLLTERRASFLRRDAGGGAGDDSSVSGRALWWPPTKIAGRELAGYLEGLGEEARIRAAGLPVAVQVNGDGGAAQDGAMEVLSLLGARD
jgi:sulfide:quinone oxidoreductase